MKLSELLLETPEHERIIQNVATDLIPAIIKAVQSAKENWVDMGEIRTIVKGAQSKSLSSLYPRLGRTKLVIVIGNLVNLRSSGAFDPVGNDITLSWPRNYSEDPDDYEEQRSTLIHELRHALDSSLSKKQGLRGLAGKMDSEFSSGHHLNADNEFRTNYLSRPYEINARFSQAQHTMQKWLDNQHAAGKQPTSQEFIKAAIPVLHKNMLSDIFPHDTDTGRQLQQMGKVFGKSVSHGIIPTNDADYKRLLTRLYKYFISSVK